MYCIPVRCLRCKGVTEYDRYCIESFLCEVHIQLDCLDFSVQAAQQTLWLQLFNRTGTGGAGHPGTR